VPGDADATRRRLLQAATDEFAAHGIAGARVDRIAAAAGSNKAQIYHYYGSKDALFAAVFDTMVEQNVAATPLDVDDLPEYAGRLFDHYEAYPHVQRLATWHRLERGGVLLDSVLASNRAKIAAIADAQAQGRLTIRWAPAELLGLVLQLAELWHGNVPEFDSLVASATRQHRRSVVVAAVAAIVRD